MNSKKCNPTGVFRTVRYFRYQADRYTGAFTVAILPVLNWAATGRMFHYSEHWHRAKMLGPEFAIHNLNNKMKKILYVLLAGVAIGLLLAPEKGSETWKKLVDGLDDIKDKAVDEMNSLMDKSKSLVAKAQHKAQTASQGLH